ncbi:hypothetical protein CTheo_6622 [Ceratobasidium theobromae]|uniref:Uncharacterized protein n=1 Tax=Ceratobasidium theobromae TaxID=1582974 RepID=A0A5N5QE48_9AGAM|nr:hypothetical protein CTheo_6622 [Ceratobasidium theobromae]
MFYNPTIHRRPVRVGVAEGEPLPPFVGNHLFVPAPAPLVYVPLFTPVLELLSASVPLDLLLPASYAAEPPRRRGRAYAVATATGLPVITPELRPTSLEKALISVLDILLRYCY